MITPYCTVEQADELLGIVEPWVGALLAEKEAALVQGTLYIDSIYYCSINPNDIPDTVVEANALLANEHLKLSLWDRQDGLGNISSKSVKAGSVETSTSYEVNKGSTWSDPFPSITALLEYNSVCYLAKGSMVTKSSVRR